MPIVSHYEINRGRQDERQKPAVGDATITLIDLTGALDPSSGSPDYYPMRPASISLTNPVTSASSPLFTGHVARWGYDLYPTENYGVATVECVDGMDILARMEMYAGQGQILEWGDYAFVSGAQDGDIWFDADDQVKHRIDSILDSAEWPVGNREVYSGNVPLRSTVYAYRTSALTAIEDAVEAEFPGGVSTFLIQKNGKATYHGRFPRFRPTVAEYHITIWEAGDLTQFAADSGTAVISDLDYDIDKDRIINSALATPEGILDAEIEAQRVEDAASIGEYGSAAWSAENLINAGDHLGAGTDANEATKKFASYYVANYKDPRCRVNRITFKSVPPGHAHAAPIWALLCGVEISDIIRLKTTHFGGAGGFDEDFYVDGLHYTVGPLAAGYHHVELELDVSPAVYWTTEPA